MAEYEESGFIKKENFYEGRQFNDKDRRAVITDRLSGPISRSLRKIFSRNEVAREETLKPFLANLASLVTEEQRAKYPFLTALGSENFDDRILTDTVRSYSQRVSKAKKNWRMRYAPVSPEEQTNRIRDAILSVYRYHIPAYEAVFSDLDMRNAAQEVFIGRDGMFMYFARKAQFWGRGESGAGKVKYLVYGMTIRDSVMTTEERKQYLKDSGITDASDAVFVDVGHIGTVPEHILRDIFGFTDKNEINKRIAMIASPFPERKVTHEMTTEESMRHSVAIEKAPKPIWHVVGLHRHPKTGKITPTEGPERPETILEHECIKYLCMRHFYLKGQSERDAVK